jgi:23S rRNA pseudouridine1911/1915/1917 synthase
MNRGWSYREQVGPDGAGLTVLDYLAATRTHSTTAEWAERFERGEVELDAVRARPDAILHKGQTLVWHRPPWAEPEVPSAFEIVHEDEALIAVDKPSGLPTMPAGGFLDNTLMSLLRHRYPEASPLHRIGRFTSGLVLFSRTHHAASTLLQAWRDHDVKKRYRAMAAGVIGGDAFPVDAAIGPVPHPELKTVFAASAGGKPSHSDVTVLERLADSTLVSVDIATGRPHQIRIHLAFAGYPLAGDPVYAVGGGIKARPGLPGDGGFLLHSERLAFAHPLTGAPTVLTAAPPQGLWTHDERRLKAEATASGLSQ